MRNTIMNLTNRLNMMVYAVMAWLFTSPVFAALPTRADVGAGAGNNPVEIAQQFFSSGYRTAATIFCAVVVVGAGWHIWTAFGEAKDKGNWKHFAITFSVALGLMGLVIALAIVGDGYASNFA